MAQQQTEQKQPLPGSPFPSPACSTVTGTLSVDGIDLTNLKPQFIPPSVQNFCTEEMFWGYPTINTSTEEIYVKRACPLYLRDRNTGTYGSMPVVPRPLFALGWFNNAEFDVTWRFRLVSPPMITGRILIRWSSSINFPDRHVGVRKEWDISSTDYFEFTVPRVNPYPVRYKNLQHSIIPTEVSGFGQPVFPSTVPTESFNLGYVKIEMLTPLRVSSIYPQSVNLIVTYSISNVRVFHPRDFTVPRDLNWTTWFETADPNYNR